MTQADSSGTPRTGRFDATTPLPDGEGQAAPRERLGDFVIVREIGRGGMGVVYEAHQQSLERHVALKVLPPHAVIDPKHLQRFRREARSAAQLHHTNIVPVYGVGQQDGVHYFAMQYIEGQGLDRVIADLQRRRDGSSPSGTKGNTDVTQEASDAPARHAAAAAGSRSTGANGSSGGADGGTAAPSAASSGGLSSSGVTRQHWDRVAEIGIQVADAIHHAHQHGILHRDIKPSNLLVDEDGKVWVTDFGLAKAMQQDDVTHTGDLVGTLRYMAPEQFRGEFDARGDQYALGLTLYELAAARPAFDATDRHELLDQVSRAEPPALRKLRRNVPRDLETIIHKAIDANPARRYASAAALSADLERFRRREPIRARRIRLPERVWRWCQRRPAVAALLALLAVVAVAAFVGVSWQLQIARAERRRAEKNLQASMDAVERMLTRVGNERLANVPYVQDVRRELLEDALEFYEGFLAQRQDDVELQLETAKVRLLVGKIRLLLGEPKLAEAALRRGVATFETLSDPADAGQVSRLADADVQLAAVLQDQGKSEEAEARLKMAQDLFGGRFREQRAFRQGAALVLSRFGALHLDLGHRQRAEAAYVGAIAILRPLHQRYPEDLGYQYDLAAAHHGLGTAYWRDERHEDAVRELESARDLRQKLLAAQPSNPDFQQRLAHTCSLLGATYDDDERKQEANQRAIELREVLAEKFPHIPDYRFRLAATLINVSGFRLDRGNVDDAQQAAERAEALLERLVQEVPAVPDYQDHLAMAMLKLSAVASARGDEALAVSRHREAAERYAALADRFADNPEYLSTAGAKLHNCAMRIAAGAPSDARELYERAIGYQQRALQLNPGHRKYLEFLGNHYKMLASLMRDLDDIDAADHWWRESITLRRQLAESWPEIARYRHAVGGALHSGALTVSRQGDHEQAVQLLNDAVAAERAALEQDPKSTAARAGLGNHYFVLAQEFDALKQSQQAEQYFQMCLAERAGLADDEPTNAEHRYRLAWGHRALAAFHRQNGALTDAEGEAETALAEARQAVRLDPANGDCLNELCRCYTELGLSKGAQGRTLASLDAFLRGSQIIEPLAAQVPSVPAYHSHLGYCLESAAGKIRPVDPLEARGLAERAAASYHTAAQLSNHPYYPEAAGRCDELVTRLAAQIDHAALARKAGQAKQLVKAATGFAKAARYVTLDEQLTPEDAAALAETYRDQAREAIAGAVDRCRRQRHKHCHLMAWYLLTAADEQLRDPPLAVEMAQIAAGHVDGGEQIGDELRGFILVTLGLALHRAGQPQEAIAPLTEAMGLDCSKRGIAGCVLALAQHALGDEEQACATFLEHRAWLRGSGRSGPGVLPFFREAAELFGMPENLWVAAEETD